MKLGLIMSRIEPVKNLYSASMRDSFTEHNLEVCGAQNCCGGSKWERIIEDF
jgi:hypothetical protein